VVSGIATITSDAATFVSLNPSHTWADGGSNEFIVDLTDQEAADIQDGTNPLTYRFGSLPRWQQETATSGATKSFGSHADPEDDQTTFTADTPIEDDRWIVRVYDDDPTTTGTHIASMEMDEGQDAGETTVYLKLYNSDDTPSTTNAQDAKTYISGTLFIFDFTNGVTTFGVSTLRAGVIRFKTDFQYRVVGPSSENETSFYIFGRTLRTV